MVPWVGAKGFNSPKISQNICFLPQVHILQHENSVNLTWHRVAPPLLKNPGSATGLITVFFRIRIFASLALLFQMPESWISR